MGDDFSTSGPAAAARAEAALDGVVDFVRAALDGDIDAAALRAWIEATERLVGWARPAADGAGASDLLDRLALLWRFGEALPALEGADEPPPAAFAARLAELCLARHQGRGALAHVRAAAAGARAAAAEAAARELLLERLHRGSDERLREAIVTSTPAAIAVLDLLRDRPATPLGERVRRLFPELAALAAPADAHAAIEHEPASSGAAPAPLLDHLAGRVLARKLRGLETGDRARFQRDGALSAAAFADEVGRLGRIRDRGLLPCVRAALVHLDFAKGGDEAQREHWRARLGADLSVHNAAARDILERASAPGFSARGLLQAFPALRAPERAALVLALVESHGLTGQAVRGEVPLVAFAPLVRYLRREAPALARHLGLPATEAARLAVACLHVVNLCDTAGVREGLLDDALRAEMTAVEARVEAVALEGAATDERAIEAELAGADDRAWEAKLPDATREMRDRGRLADRLLRLRKGRIATGERAELARRAVDALPRAAVERLGGLLSRCQLWYAEAGTAALTPEAQLKVLALGLRAGAAALADPERGFHVTLLPLVARLHAGADRSVPYRVRLVEALLAPIPLERLLGVPHASESQRAMGQANESDAAASENRRVGSILDGAAPGGALGTFEAEIGGRRAVELDFLESAEAAALLTLLPIYETKSSAAFHATLKTLCDLYGLRKDEFDRVSNEAIYLAHMNSARSDKARMLDHVRPGRIVEVGPGGGVILDLLEERFPAAEVIGIDVSRMVVEALEQRRKRDGRRWTVVEADAFKLAEIVGAGRVDTVIFCSLLHEIYSYVDWPDDKSGERKKFQLESVRAFLRASWETLVPGGRIVIRDGLMPPPVERILRFLTPDARELFELFARQFEGRKIQSEPAGADAVRLSSADAAEFLFKLTWGAESFPYEVREQYCVLPYEAYRDAILSWLPGARWVPLPVEERSYLQPGYRQGLAGKVELLDGRGAPVELPDSNCLLIFEKAAG